jgi:hypothetical protein
VCINKYKKNWEADILDLWDNYSDRFNGSKEGVTEFIRKWAKNKYYGYNLFWVENYKNQKGLKKNMWLAVNHERLVLVNDNLKGEIMEFSYDEWENDYYPNAIIFKDKNEQMIRLTTSMVYPAYFLIEHYRKWRRMEKEGKYSGHSYIEEEKKEGEKEEEEKKGE